MVRQSDWEAHDSFLLVGFHKIVDEIRIENRLDDSCNERRPNDMFPLENPTLNH